MRQAAARLRHLEAQIGAVRDEIDALIESQPTHTWRREIRVSIPIISKHTAAALMVEAPELGTLEAWTGRQPRRSGADPASGAAEPPSAADALICARPSPFPLVAARFDPDFEILHDRLIGAGKPPKVVLTAVMRKLVILANAFPREERKWTPKPA